MTDQQNSRPPPSNPPPPPPSSSGFSRVLGETSSSSSDVSAAAAKKLHYPNPPDLSNPDPATLREQWRFAIRQYSRWYSQAWGSAILAGLSFFALGWFIKGSNPLPSKQEQEDNKTPPSPSHP